MVSFSVPFVKRKISERHLNFVYYQFVIFIAFNRQYKKYKINKYINGTSAYIKLYLFIDLYELRVGE